VEAAVCGRAGLPLCMRLAGIPLRDNAELILQPLRPIAKLKRTVSDIIANRLVDPTSVAKQDSRVSTQPQWVRFSNRTKRVMPGARSWSSAGQFRRPATEIPCGYTSRKQTRTSLLAGRERTIPMAKPLSRNQHAAPAPSSTAQYGTSSSKLDPKTSNIFWLVFRQSVLK